MSGDDLLKARAEVYRLGEWALRVESALVEVIRNHGYIGELSPEAHSVIADILQREVRDE